MEKKTAAAVAIAAVGAGLIGYEIWRANKVTTPPPVTCTSDSNCSSGQQCQGGVCVTPTPAPVPQTCTPGAIQNTLLCSDGSLKHQEICQNGTWISQDYPCPPSTTPPPPTTGGPPAVCNTGSIRNQLYCPNGNLTHTENCEGGQWVPHDWPCAGLQPGTCSSDGECPTDYTCQAGTCVLKGGGPIDLENIPMTLLSAAQVNGKVWIAHAQISGCYGFYCYDIAGNLTNNPNFCVNQAQKPLDYKLVITDFDSIMQIARQSSQQGLTLGQWFCKNGIGPLGNPLGNQYNARFFTILQIGSPGTLTTFLRVVGDVFAL